MTYRSRGLVVIVGAVVGVLAAGWAASAQVGHDHSSHSHGDHHHAATLGHDSRFTAPGQVWPPQPKGATEVVTHDAGLLAPESPQMGLAALDARAGTGPVPSEVAATDADVVAALGERSNLIATWDADGDSVLLYYSLSNNQTVEVTVSGDGGPTTVDRRDPEVWQPPLSEDEKVAAADVARAYWQNRGNARVDELDGYSILAFAPDGAYYDTRMVYVSFHSAPDARPELINWVDLATGEVVRAEVEDLTGPTALDDSTNPAAPFDGAAAADSQADLAVSGASMSFRGWDFEASVESGLFDGLSLRNVSYNGVSVLRRASMPAMTVYYDELCGPYVDRIGGPFFEAEGPTEFTLDGVRWLQMGITDFIGNYVITQMYYFSEDGRFDFHLFSKGLQCNIRHDHYPFLRLDTELGAPGGDVIHRGLADGTSQAMTTEFSLRATEAFEHRWEVRDSHSGYTLTVDFDDNNPGLTDPDPVVPISDYLNNFVFGRQFMPGEEVWQGGASLGFYGDNGQTITDAVLAYRGYMPHTAEEGPNLWHSTGIRTTVVAPTVVPGRITGVVTNPFLGPEAEIKIDLFTERRARFLRTTRTATDGTFSFEVGAGCYVVTFVAPDDGSTLADGGRFLNKPVCVSSGQTLAGINAVVVPPNGGAATVGGNVSFWEGTPAVGLKANLFSAGRADFLGLARTGTAGNYRFDLALPRCGVVTLIAPNGTVFQQSGGRFQNLEFCASAGQQISNLNGVLLIPNTSAAVGGGVADAAGPVAGVKAILYQAGADGRRAGFLDRAFTDGLGLWGIDVAPGCYVIDLEAPAGRTWLANGGRYLQWSGCVQSGDFDNTIGGFLSP